MCPAASSLLRFPSSLVHFNGKCCSFLARLNLTVFWRLKRSSQSQINQTQLIFAKYWGDTGTEKSYRILSQWRHVATLSFCSWQHFLLDLWPWGEPPQTEQTNEPDALFIIEKAKPRTKAEAKAKKHGNIPKAERRYAFFPCPSCYARQPEACAKYNTVWIKDCCSAHGNVRRCGRQILYALIQESKWSLLILISGGLPR